MKVLSTILIVLVSLSMWGCSVQTRPTFKVSSLETTESIQDLYPEIGLLYDYFNEYNTWSLAEEATMQNAYQGMIRAITKLQRKTIAGQTDYHRLKYFNEDMTEYWEVMRAGLNVQADVKDLGHDPYALALYRRIRADVDMILTLNNTRLNLAVDKMNKETYDAIRGDALRMIKTMTPLFQKGAAFLL